MGNSSCVTGKCFEKPQTFPNKTKLEKQQTCHENPKCGQCGKVFGARRNLRRHENNVHANDHANLSTNSNKSDGDNNGNTPALKRRFLVPKCLFFFIKFINGL